MTDQEVYIEPTMQAPNDAATTWVGPVTRGRTATWVRRVAIAIAGFTVLLVGLVLLVVPVPGTSVVVIPLGLAILACEFQWARRLLDGMTAALKRARAGVRRLLGKTPIVPVWVHQ